ncbi:microfibril-associated glycoprotein 4-like [Ranitomeya imitator]|uniref:microfibril-associated glycoprotein 4-like n=1 Tax=Ranitomeya imitator TaxID=111125 RepID=UPI0037E82CD0
MKIVLVLGFYLIPQVTGSWKKSPPALRPLCDGGRLPVDCQDICDLQGPPSGVYIIYPQGAQRPLPVYCDVTGDGLVWTVFQRRLDGSEEFGRPWQDYVRGFGSADGEYWLGLQNIYRLTVSGDYELRVELEDAEGTRVTAQYTNFSLSHHALNPDSDGYRLHLGAFSDGGAGDALSLHAGHTFSTYDHDQDGHAQNCAEYWGGGFWYHTGGCAEAGLNARYHMTDPLHPAFSWTTWVDYPLTLRGSQMKLRRVSA